MRRKTHDGEEETPGEYVYNGSVANKALELIGANDGANNGSTPQRPFNALVRAPRGQFAGRFRGWS